MANGCTNGKLDDAKYSTHVPLVGLYIAASSLLCLLFMLLDIRTAFRQRKRWIPCQLFSLNSVTLTLLSICAKLPVDLTTPMPTSQDQLSKLSATTLVCISMAFFNPSLGDSNPFESSTNMVALSILVITIIVNICIQISTGVIYIFIKENIIIMCCMLVSLLGFWYSVMFVNSQKGSSLPYSKKFITKGTGSMLQRLKLSYIYGFGSNPHLKISRGRFNFTVAALCSICLVVLTQATIRSLILKQIQFCDGVSDYEWSMWLIVVAQILTITVGCLATSFRWVTLSSHGLDAANTLMGNNPIMRARSSWDMCGAYLVVLIMFIIIIPCIVVVILTEIFSSFDCSLRNYEEEDAVQEFKHLIGDGKRKLDGWIVWKAVDDMNKWMEVNKSEPPKFMFQFLSGTKPSQHLHNLELEDGSSFDYEGIKVSSFSIAILVGIATLSIPNRLVQSIERTFGEAYELIEFVDTRIFSGNSLHQVLARAILEGNGFQTCLPKIIKRSTYRDEYEFDSLSEFTRACVIIKDLKNTLGHDMIWKEVRSITDLLNLQVYNTVDVLHLFFSQLPNAIFKEVNESQAEEVEERVRVGLKLLCMVEPLEAQVQWSFPAGCTISSLVITSLNDILQEEN